MTIYQNLIAGEWVGSNATKNINPSDTNEVVDIMAKHINSVIVGDETAEGGAKAMNQEVEDLRRERGLIKS